MGEDHGSPRRGLSLTHKLRKYNIGMGQVELAGELVLGSGFRAKIHSSMGRP